MIQQHYFIKQIFTWVVNKQFLNQLNRCKQTKNKNLKFIFFIVVDEDMDNIILILKNVLKLFIQKLKQVENKLRMYLDILKQLFLKMVKKNQFIPKRMEMVCLAKRLVKKYWRNQELMLRPDEKNKEHHMYIDIIHKINI